MNIPSSLPLQLLSETSKFSETSVIGKQLFLTRKAETALLVAEDNG